MKKWIILGVVACFLVTGCCAAFANRVKGDDNPVGIGEKLNFYATEYIQWDEPCWLRVGAYHPVYAGGIPDLKEEAGRRSIAVGGLSVDILIDGIPLRKGVERSVVWRDDTPFSLDLPYPDEYDTKFTWYFVQFPPCYFDPGVHEIVIIATSNNPNSYMHELYATTPVIIDIELHVAE